MKNSKNSMDILDDASPDLIKSSKKRRQLLKTAGIAWVAPVITSVSLPSHAQTSVSALGTTSCSTTFAAGGTFTVPAGVTEISFSVAGAQGGDGGREDQLANGADPFVAGSAGGDGGLGSVVTGTVTVTAGLALTISIGQMGGDGLDSDHRGNVASPGTGGTGGTGYTAGGVGGSGSGNNNRHTGGGGGGGASAIVGGAVLVVAGGGGGGGGANFGAIGADGGNGDTAGSDGVGGTAGGAVGVSGSAAAGQAGIDGTSNGSRAGGGGGGGYAGGSGGDSNNGGPAGSGGGGGGGASTGGSVSGTNSGGGSVTIGWNAETCS